MSSLALVRQASDQLTISEFQGSMSSSTTITCLYAQIVGFEPHSALAIRSAWPSTSGLIETTQVA